MPSRILFRTPLVLLLLAGLFLASCSPLSALLKGRDISTPTPSAPEWFDMSMTDVLTGQEFTINDFAGKVVLVETMATWCPTCWKQENEVKKLLESLGPSSDLVAVSLDVDTNEDAATLKTFATTGGYTWRFVVAPLPVARALGNLYSTDYLNPPLAPMLFIDRQGGVYGLPNGVKGAEALSKTLEQYLKP
jgi:thiol:disulfide interchange protein